MIAYNPTWLANLRLQEILKDDLSKGRISDDEFKAISVKYPVGFYTPGFFARMGLFIVTCIVALFAFGLIALMADSGNIIDTPGFPFTLGVLSYIALEAMVNANKHYRSGVDDALLYASAGAFSAAVVMMFHYGYNQNNDVAIWGIIFLLALFLAIRFTDMLITALCAVSFFLFIYFTWTRIIPSGAATVPFILMLVSAGAYWFVYANRAKHLHYENCLIIAQVGCLLVLYAAGNYYVIQTLGDELRGTINSPVPFAGVFWAWTIGLPFVYLGFGVKRKDVILLRIGLLLIAAAALTFRTYYYVLQLDVALTLVGAILLSIAYGVIKYLKTPKHGFTYAEPEDEHEIDRLKVESLLIAESFSTAPAAPSATGTRFGGGDFGGGGSSANF